MWENIFIDSSCDFFLDHLSFNWGTINVSMSTGCKLTMWMCISNFFVLNVYWDAAKILLSCLKLRTRDVCRASPNLWLLTNTYLIWLRQFCFIYLHCLVLLPWQGILVYCLRLYSLKSYCLGSNSSEMWTWVNHSHCLCFS